MTLYWEVVLKLSALEEDRYTAKFRRWLQEEPWQGGSPDTPCDLDMDLVSRRHVEIANLLVSRFVKQWADYVSPHKMQYFAQLEYAQGEGYHVHLLYSQAGSNSSVLGRKVYAILRRAAQGVIDNPEADNRWFQMAKTSVSYGANKTYNEFYIPNYLLKKQQDELQWAWTNIPEYINAQVSLEERQKLVEANRANIPAAAEEGEASAGPSQGPISKNRQTEAYMELVEWLVSEGITSEKQWVRENKESYLSYNATSSSRGQIKAALDNAAKLMMLTKEASDYLIGPSPPEDVRENRIWKILDLNGYDPAVVGTILVGWCKRQWGKRNTVWLFGPATTGKTNIAEAVAHAVPHYGNVNWTNENFPFNDCVDKHLIWWEEGRMTARVVEPAKAILGGSAVRVDKKCKDSLQIEPTPVIITSNTNMCCVTDGNSTTYEHAEPLEDRMWRIDLLRKLPHDFGKVTKREVREFFAWAAANPVAVEPAFLVPKGAQTHPLMLIGQKRERGEEPRGEDKVPSKRARPSVAEPEPEEKELLSDYAARYANRCSRHVGMVSMAFPCGTCHKLSQPPNVCILHGEQDCLSCFPRPVSEGEVRAFHRDYFNSRYKENRCDSHGAGDILEECKYCEYLNRGWNGCMRHNVVKCPECWASPPWSENNCDLDDCDDEQ